MKKKKEEEKNERDQKRLTYEHVTQIIVFYTRN